MLHDIGRAVEVPGLSAEDRDRDQVPVVGGHGGEVGGLAENHGGENRAPQAACRPLPHGGQQRAVSHQQRRNDHRAVPVLGDESYGSRCAVGLKRPAQPNEDGQKHEKRGGNTRPLNRAGSLSSTPRARAAASASTGMNTKVHRFDMELNPFMTPETAGKNTAAATTSQNPD